MTFRVCHGLERYGLAIEQVLATVPSRAEVRRDASSVKRQTAWLTRLAAVVAQSIAGAFRRQTVAHVLTRATICSGRKSL